MGQLLDALRAAGRPSSRWVAPVVLAVAIGAGGVVWHERRDPCNAAGERIESAFAPSLAEPLHAAAGASGLPFAADAVATVHALAEQSVHSLAQTSAAACRLALPPEHADRTKHCLTWSEQRLQHEVNRLQNGDHGGEEHRERWIAAVDRLAELSSPTLCLDVERLASWSSEPPDDPDAFFRLADKLAELDPRGTGETLDHAAALGRVMAIEREAEDSGHPLVRVWAAMRQAELRTRLGENREAEDTLRRVIGEAEALGDTHLRVHAQALLVYVVGLDPERRGVAEVLAEQALAGLGDGLRDELYRARILSHRGIMYARARDRDYARAEQDHAVAVSLLVRHLGEQHPQSIAARVNWATALTRSGEAAQALPVAREAWQDARALWGDDHPQTGKVAAALALTSMRVGDLPEAEFLLRSALAIFEKAAQANDVEITNTLYDLHLVLVRADRPVEATKALTDGLARFEQRVGAEHPSLIPWLFALGHLELGAQRHPQAEASFDRALALCENDGAPAYDFSRIRLGLARSVAATEPGKARVLAEQACTFFAESPEHRTSEADCRRFLTDLAGP
jgi:tetratricopeptide (TPR) repeat protein